jgi:hypothetical protein
MDPIVLLIVLALAKYGVTDAAVGSCQSRTTLQLGGCWVSCHRMLTTE